MELARWAVEQARKAGATDASVDIGTWRSIEIDYRDGKLEKIQESTQSSLNLGVYVEHKYTNHSTNDVRKESLVPFIEEAVAMTKYLSEDEYRALPDPKYYEGRQDINLQQFDPSYESVSTDQRIQIARKIQEIASAQSDKIISCTASYGDTYYEAVKATSNGCEARRYGTQFSAGAAVTVRDGDKGRPEDWDWATVCRLEELPNAEKLGKTSAKRALSKIGQVKMTSGVYDMVVANRAGSRLIYAYYAPMQARAIQQKRSFLEGKLGKRVGSERFTLIDDPFVPGGLGSRTYDGEGLALKRRVMIDKGILKNYYVDTYYGKKLGWEPTTGSSTNVVMEYGDKSLDQLVAGMEKGILVNGFIGGNSNSTTGDYSYGIVGELIENGKSVQAVNEMNISGNMTELWMKLADVGNDPYIYSSWRRPSMYFKEVHFAGV
jgi:PmbA protein